MFEISNSQQALRDYEISPQCFPLFLQESTFTNFPVLLNPVSFLNYYILQHSFKPHIISSGRQQKIFVPAILDSIYSHCITLALSTILLLTEITGMAALKEKNHTT